MKKLLILLILLITGCTNYTELNNIGVVDIVGIEKQSDSYLITINIEEMDDTLTTNTYQSSGRNIIEIFNNINLTIDKKLNFSHIQALIFNNTVKKNDLKEIIEYLKTNNEFRNDFNTIYTENNIKDILSLKISGELINEQIIENNKALSNTSLTPFENVIKNFLDKKNTFIPSITLKDEEIIISPYQIITSDKKLTEEESIIYNYLKNKINKHTLTTECMIIQVDNSTTLISNDNKKITINITSDIYQKDKLCPSTESIKEIYAFELKKQINEFIDKFKDERIFEQDSKIKININSKVIK